MRALWKFRDFRIQFIALAVSIVGSTLSPVALSLGILKLTGSTSDLGAVLAASALPAVIFLLAGGVWADRLPRHIIMVTCEIIVACTQLALGIMLITGHFSLWPAMVLQFIAGTALAFYYPATTGLTALTVPKEHLQKANALMSMTRNIAGGLGPVVAAGLVIWVGAGWALAFDGITFLASALLLAQIKVRMPKSTNERAGFLRELAQGFREVTTRGWVWSSIGAFMFTNLAMAFFIVLGPSSLLGRDKGELAWGAVIAAMSCGQIIGDVLAIRHVPKRPMVASRFVEMLVVPVLLALALDAPVPVLMAGAVLAGVAMTFPDTLWYTAMQQHLPPETLSRVSSFDWLGSLALRPSGYIAAAALSSSIGIAKTLGLAAAAVVLTRLGSLSLRSVRQLSTVQSGAQ